MRTLAVTGHLPRLRQSPLPQWRAGWAALPGWARGPWLAVVVAAGLGSVGLGLQLGGAGAMEGLSAGAYIVVPLAAGLLLMVATGRRRAPGAAGWMLIGLGVAFWGIGEIVWNYATYVVGEELPYPGVADVFYVAAYPIIFAGVLMLPHIRAARWERLRLTLDALAGSIALGAVTWEFYLRSVVQLDPDAGLLENTIAIAYPIGDLLLLVALMILATRRSPLRFDGRLLVIGGGMALTAVADVMFVFQIDAGTYVDGGRLDGLWLAAYGLFGFVAVLVAGPPRVREQADRASRVWPLIAPYGAIGVLFALALREVGGRASVLEVGTATVGILIIARQVVAIRETREVVEKQRNDLVASISHELRTPLTAMAGFVEILQDSPDLDPAERSEMLAIVAIQTRHLSRIVGDLIDVARNRLENIPLDSRSVRVADLVDSAIGMVSVDPSQCRVTMNVESDLAVVGDRDRLRQVLVNFLTNAVRYGGGRVEVRARAAEQSVVIEVHDDGPGIPKKYELTVWDRFERGPHTYMSSVQGSGLGLAIARQLVTAHRGQTGHRPSEILGGACFWLTIPTYAANLLEPAPQPVSA